MRVLVLNRPHLGESQRKHDEHAQACEQPSADQELGLGHAPEYSPGRPNGQDAVLVPRLPTYQASLQRSQEIQQVLLRPIVQAVEVGDHLVRLRGSARQPGAPAGVGLDGLYEVRRAPVMQQEDALTEAPQRGCSELIRTGLPLLNVVR